MKYSILRQTEAILDISAPGGGAMYAQPVAAAVPATVLIHAVRAADDQVMCTYTPKSADTADPSRDWTTVGPAEVPCEDCSEAIKLAERKVAQ